MKRDFDVLLRQQIPYAQALALTEIAQEVAKAETDEAIKDLKNPTKFTQNAFGVKAARKSNPESIVFIKDIQAAYLDPTISGGLQVLGSKKAILTPRDLATNQYGNLPKGKLAALAARPDIFIGQVKTKNGVIGGVWQRVDYTRNGKRRTKGAPRAGLYSPEQGRLKLLIQFTRPAEVTAHFSYFERAQSVVDRTWRRAMEQGLAKALSTAK